MSDTLMALGGYRFCIDSAVYQTLKRSQSYRWQGQARLNRRPAQQFIGLGDETLEFSGVIYPHYRGGLKQFEKLQTEAGKVSLYYWLMASNLSGDYGSLRT